MTTDRATTDAETTHREYILGVAVVTVTTEDGIRYRFEAPEHESVTFDDPELATLYADVYFDTNGFVEAGTGDRGVPPEVIQAGRDTMAAYMLTLPGTDVNWLASFYGKRRNVVERYVANVRGRAQEIRDRARSEGIVESPSA